VSNFAERLRLAMKRAEIIQAELCEKTGIGKSSISQYLSGEYEPKQKKIYKLATALNVSPSYLMGFTDDPVDYNDPDLIADISNTVLDHFDGDVKKAVEFQKAVDEDAQNFNQESDQHVSNVNSPNQKTIDDKVDETQQKMTPELDAASKALLKLFKDPDSPAAKEAVRKSLEAGFELGKLEIYLSWLDFMDSRNKPPNE